MRPTIEIQSAACGALVGCFVPKTRIIANPSLQFCEMSTVDEPSRLDSSSNSLAAGERVNVRPASPLTWRLPRPATVTQDALLQASYEYRRSVINNIVFKDMLHLRQLLLIYRQIVYVEPHQLHEFDEKIRYLDDMVDAFITKWTFRTHNWSTDSTSKTFPTEYAELIHEMVDFIAKARSVMQFVYKLHVRRR